MYPEQNALLSDSVIREMFFGDISPEGSAVYNTPELMHIQEDIDIWKEKLRDSFTDEQQTIYEQLLHHVRERETIREMEVFMYAFKLGARMILELSKTPATP